MYYKICDYAQIIILQSDFVVVKLQSGRRE